MAFSHIAELRGRRDGQTFSDFSHRLVWDGKNVKDHPVPITPCQGQGHFPLEQVAQKLSCYLFPLLCIFLSGRPFAIPKAKAEHNRIGQVSLKGWPGQGGWWPCRRGFIIPCGAEAGPG